MNHKLLWCLMIWVVLRPLCSSLSFQVQAKQSELKSSELLRFTCAQAVNPEATQSTPMFKSCVSGRNSTQLNSTKVDLSSVQISSLQKNSTEPGRKPWNT